MPAAGSKLENDVGRYPWLQLQRSLSLPAMLRTLVFTNGGKHVWLAFRDGTIHVCDATNGDIIRRIGENGRFFATAILAEGDRVWVGSADGDLRGFDRVGRTVLCHEAGHGGAIRSLHMAGDGYLWSAGAHGAFCQRDPRNGRIRRELSLGPRHINFRDMCCVNHRIWTASDDGIRVWDMLEDGTTSLFSHLAKQRPGPAVSLATAGLHMWSGTVDGRICVWNAEDCTLETVIDAHANCWVFQLSVINGTVWSVAMDGSLRVWDAFSFTCYLSLRRNEKIAAICCFPDPTKGSTSPPTANGTASVWIGFRNPSTIERYVVAPLSSISQSDEILLPAAADSHLLDSSRVYDIDQDSRIDTPEFYSADSARSISDNESVASFDNCDQAADRSISRLSFPVTELKVLEGMVDRLSDELRREKIETVRLRQIIESGRSDLNWHAVHDDSVPHLQDQVHRVTQADHGNDHSLRARLAQILAEDLGLRIGERRSRSRVPLSDSAFNFADRDWRQSFSEPLEVPRKPTSINTKVERHDLRKNSWQVKGNSRRSTQGALASARSESDRVVPNDIVALSASRVDTLDQGIKSTRRKLRKGAQSFRENTQSKSRKITAVSDKRAIQRIQNRLRTIEKEIRKKG